MNRINTIKTAPPNTQYKKLGFYWYAKRITRWQGSYRWIGKRPRNPLRST